LSFAPARQTRFGPHLKSFDLQGNEGRRRPGNGIEWYKRIAAAELILILGGITIWFANDKKYLETRIEQNAEILNRFVIKVEAMSDIQASMQGDLRWIQADVKEITSIMRKEYSVERKRAD